MTNDRCLSKEESVLKRSYYDDYPANQKLFKNVTNNNLSNMSFALEEKENSCRQELQRKLNELQLENDYYKEKINLHLIEIDGLNLDIERQSQELKTKRSITLSNFEDETNNDCKMAMIKNYMVVMAEKILVLIRSYESFQQDVLKTAEILSYSLNSKKDDRESLGMGIELQKGLLMLKEDE